jgi:hypothetical protein
MRCCWDYYWQIFWAGIDLNDSASLTTVTLDALELSAGERAVLSLQLPPQFIIIFEPVTHSAHFIDVQGEPTQEHQQLDLLFNKAHPPTGSITLRPGPLRLSLDNQSGVRTLPTVFIAAGALHDLLGKRRPFLTAKRMLSNQTFRDVFKADNLNIDQRLKITSLTFLFTDLKGSTALYERVGDLVAFDLVRAHFHALHKFAPRARWSRLSATPSWRHSCGPSKRWPRARGCEGRRWASSTMPGKQDLIVKIGIHEGPCLAVMLKAAGLFRPDRQIAARCRACRHARDPSRAP